MSELKLKVTVDPKEKEEMAKLWSNILKIDEKSNCGSIKALDAIALFLEKCARGLHNLAQKVRTFTWKISAPCTISFAKKEKP